MHCPHGKSSRLLPKRLKQPVQHPPDTAAASFLSRLPWHRSSNAPTVPPPRFPSTTRPMGRTVHIAVCGTCRRVRRGGGPWNWQWLCRAPFSAVLRPSDCCRGRRARTRRVRSLPSGHRRNVGSLTPAIRCESISDERQSQMDSHLILMVVVRRTARRRCLPPPTLRRPDRRCFHRWRQPRETRRFY